MTKTIQLLRGTTAQNDAFTGAAGEVTVDTQTHELRVHDGSTVGGFTIPKKSDVQSLLGGGTTGTLLTNSGTPGTVKSTSIDATPTDGSNNPVSSNGVYDELSGKANTSLNNLTAAGANITNWSSNVSNCIIEIPQNINLTLLNGTLTLKSGSKVYIPNGAGVFDTYTTTSDKTMTFTNNGTYILDINNSNGLDLQNANSVSSGNSLPASYSGLFYDTTNNIISWYNNGAVVRQKYSFPICIFTVSNGAISSIDQVFNGFGYIGSTVFALPGVKGLIPNGRNANGTLKNTVYSLSSVVIQTFTSSTSITTLAIRNNNVIIEGNGIWYDSVNNYNYYSANSTTALKAVLVATATLTSGTISNWKPKQVFHVADYDNVMKGATSSVAGTQGLVPAPRAGDNKKCLLGDGTWGFTYFPDLFDVKWADHICNDVQWLRADTFSWQSGTVYQVAYQHLVDDYNEASTTSYWSPAIQDTNLGANYWDGLAWDGSKFVALGADGHISTSTDGTNWTAAVQNTNLGAHDWYALAWNGSKFVALGNRGYISTSTDGTNWTPAVQDTINLGGSHDWMSLAWNGSKFVALGNTGYVSTSTDGTNWTPAVQNTNLGSHRWRALAWDGSKFVALGADGHISTSTDGTNWTAAVQNTNLGAHGWYALAFNGSMFVAISVYGHISTSTDGTTWSTATQNANLGENAWYDLAWNGSEFVALGQSGYTAFQASYQTETISGITIEYYLAEDGHKLVLPDQESNVTAIYNATGVAWYYILDTINQRFKLPRTQYGFTGLRDTVEKYVAESLPNIRGYNLDGAYVTGSGGSFVARTVSRATGAHSAGGSETTDFDASVSSSTYQDDAPVQERATQMYLYFYVGSFTQTAIENTAGLNASLFNGKADLDFGNTTMIDYVVEKQDPTALNNYTWYRKYKSGWVEQGSLKTNSSGTASVTIPVEMSDTNYTVLIGDGVYAYANADVRVRYVQSKTTTGFTTSSASGISFNWQVSGVAAS